jgi:hypothetical protein
VVNVNDRSASSMAKSILEREQKMKARDRLTLRIVFWIAIAVVVAIAFHYAKKYEGDMLTDHFQTNAMPPSAP